VKAVLFSIVLIWALFLSAPPPAHATWWGWGGDNGRRELDLEGYDANTVTTVSGRIKAIHSEDSPQVRVDLETDEGRIVALLGPKAYWAEHGIKLTVGDRMTIRGSKAQGDKGVVYLLAQKIAIGHGQEVALRNDSGRPTWGDGSSRVGFGGGSAGQLRQNSPMRIGGGRMGR